MSEILELNKIGEGQDSEVYSIENNKVIKLFRSSKYEKAALRERNILELLNQTGISVPKVYEYVNIEGRPGFIMERIDGNSLISIVEKKPYLMLKMAKQFGKMHAEIHVKNAPIDLPPLKEELKHSIKRVNCLPIEILEYTIELINKLPNGNSICHGDYNPSNVILNSAKPVFIDWGAVSKGDATADVAHTLLILKNGQFPPNTSSFSKIIFGLGRKIFANMYFHIYQKCNPLDKQTLCNWEMIRAVDRLSYGGAEERPALLKFINRCYEERNRNSNILF